MKKNEAIAVTATMVERMKREAKAPRKSNGTPHHAALEQVARAQGFASWHAVTKAAAATGARSGATPHVGTPAPASHAGNSTPERAPVASAQKSERVGERGASK